MGGRLPSASHEASILPTLSRPKNEIDHTRSGSVGGNRVQLVRHIAAVQRRAGHVLVIMHQEFARLNAACGETHHGNGVRVDTVDRRILSNKAHGAGDIQRALLLRVGRQAVIHNEGLEAQLAQRRRRGQGICIVAAELIRAARHQHHRPLGLNARTHGNRRDVRPEIPRVEIAAHVLGKAGPGGNVALLPQIQRLNVFGIGSRIQHGGVALRIRQPPQHIAAGIVLNSARAVIVFRREIIRGGNGVGGSASAGRHTKRRQSS